MLTHSPPTIERCSRTTAHKLHIVHGVLSLDVGGLERLVVDMARASRCRDERVSVVCIERPGQLAELVQGFGVELHCLDKPRGRSTAAVKQAVKLLDCLQPDVVHTHQIGALWYLGQAARKRKTPVVHTEHSDHVAHARGWLEQLKIRLRWRNTAPFADRFCCVSEDIARAVRRFGTVPSSKVAVVLNGIDLSHYDTPAAPAEVRTELGLPPGALVIGTVGRLVEVKRQALLLTAFARLIASGRHPHTRLLIVGDGPERPRLESLASKLNISEHTVFAGYQAKPERMLRAMDLFVLTSRHEGLPLALLEAWAAGLAVVSSAVGAIPQTIVHGTSGMLFPSGDVAALTQTLEGLLDAPWIVKQLGKCGRLRVESSYSLARMAATYREHYDVVIGQAHG